MRLVGWLVGWLAGSMYLEKGEGEGESVYQLSFLCPGGWRLEIGFCEMELSFFNGLMD